MKMPFKKEFKMHYEIITFSLPGKLVRVHGIKSRILMINVRAKTLLLVG